MATQTGRDVVVTLTVELIGVLLLSVVAGINDELGDLAVIFIFGLALGWLMVNAGQLNTWFGKAGLTSSGTSSNNSGTVLA